MTTALPTRRRRIAIITVAAAIVVACVAGLLWSSGGDAPPPREDADAAVDDAAAPGARGPLPVDAGAAPSRDPATVEAPLPALDVPFDRTYADLKRAADAGQPKAACRLAAEFDQCDRRRQELARLDAGIRQIGLSPLPPSNAPAMRQRMQDGRRRALVDLGQQSERALRGLEQCDRVPAASPAQRTGYWRSAALGGHLPSLTQYAVGNGFKWRDLLQNLPALTVYRGEAEALARRAAAAGDPQAMLALAHAYTGSNQDERSRPFLMQVVRPNDIEALALYQRVAAALKDDQRPTALSMRASIDRRVQLLQRDMPAAQQTDANALARRHDSEWRAPDLRNLPSLAAANGGVVHEADRAICSEDRFVGR